MTEPLDALEGAFDAPQPLDALEEFVSRFVVLTRDQLVGVVLWIVHSHAIDAAETTPYLAITSPSKRTGKSRLLEVCELVVRKPLTAANVTPAALFRSLAEEARTLLMDEVDAIYGPKANGNEDLRALLNAGYRRGTPVLRCVGDGARMRVEPFNVYGAKALSGIGRLPDTIADRCLPIRMKRRARDERIERLRRRDVQAEAETLRELCAVWALENLDALAVARPDLPSELDDRAQDACEPLVAIADLAGGEWPAWARKALVALRAQSDEDEATAGERILADCRTIFEERAVDRMASADLLEALGSDEEAPWADWRGNGLTLRGLARLLDPYGIKSRTIRVGDATPRGYLRASFEDAWTRYTLVSTPSSATTPHPSSHAGLGRFTLDSGESEVQRLNAFTDAGCGVVALENAKQGADDDLEWIGTASLDELRERFSATPLSPLALTRDRKEPLPAPCADCRSFYCPRPDSDWCRREQKEAATRGKQP
jgi:hypothetical protein